MYSPDGVVHNANRATKTDVSKSFHGSSLVCCENRQENDRNIKGNEFPVKFKGYCIWVWM